jgi:hypothetical protein
MVRKAFVVGANNNKLKYAVEDANKIYQALGKHGYVLNSLKVSSFNPADFIVGLKKFVEDLDREDLFIFYFVGHSFLGRNNVLTFLIENSDPNDIKTCLGATEIVYPIQQCKAKNKLIILDSCSSAGINSEVNLTMRNVNYGIINASEPWEDVPELWTYPELGINGGLLSHFFYKALSGEDERALNHQKELTPNSFLDWLSKEMEKFKSYNFPKFRIFGSYSSSIAIANLESPFSDLPIVQKIESTDQKRLLLNNKPNISISFRSQFLRNKMEDLIQQFANVEEELAILRTERSLTLDPINRIKLERLIENKQDHIFNIVEEIEQIEEKLDDF